MTTPTTTRTKLALSAALALAYFVTGRLGLMLPALSPNITLIWLPTGITVAVFLRYGYGLWPGAAIGALAVVLAMGASWPVGLAVAAGNTLGPLVTTWLLRRFKFQPALDRQRDILLLTLAAMVGMSVTASVGVGAFVLEGAMPEGRLAAWLTWWAGDSMGVIIAAPLVFALFVPEFRAMQIRRGEFAVWLALTAMIAWGVFILNQGSGGHPWALAFVPLTMVTWGALRYGPVGTSLAIIVISVCAAYGTATDHGPFSSPQPSESAAFLWIFMTTSAVIGWVTSALHSTSVRTAGIQRVLEQALSDVSLGVTLAGTDRRITYVNEGFTRLTGYSATEVLGESYAMLQGPGTDLATAERLRAALQAGDDFEGEILNYRQDGTTFWNALVISPARDKRGKQVGFLGIQRDITKQKAAQLALRESEAQHRMLARSVPVGIFRTDAKGSCLYVNDRWCEMTGLSESEAQGSGWVAALHEDDRKRVFEEWTHAAEAGVEYESDYRLRSSDGKVSWVHVLATLQRDHDGNVSGYLGSITNVTERRRTQARTEGERAVLELLAAGAPLAAVLDRLARSYEEIFPGMYCSVLLLDEDGERLHHGAAPSLPKEFCAAVDGAAIGPKAGSCGTAAFTGKAVLVEDITTDPLWDDYAELARKHELRACWSLPVKSSQGNVLGTLAVYSRTACAPNAEELAAIERGAHFAGLALERHDLMRSLRESQARLETLVANLPGMAYRCRKDGMWTMTYVSEGCEAITGYRREELEENRVIRYSQLMHAEDRAEHLTRCRTMIDAHKSYRGEYRLIDRHGRERWIHESASGVYGDDGTVLFVDGFIQDITAARNEKAEREQLDRKVRETQKLESLGVLAGGIAHDFNNLLASVLGNASLAAMDLPADSPIQEHIAQITEASVRAAELCNQMLAYSGKGRFVVETLDLGQLVEETAQMLRISISKKAMLRFHMEPGLPQVEVDATQIRQVIMNLVINASEAIGDESGVITLTTGVVRVDRAYLAKALMDSDLAEGDYVYLEVSDSGSGMSAETKAKIFDPFFTTKFAGRGLGLAAVLGIARGHKGTLEVHSESGQGTTFRLLFPASGKARETAVVVSDTLDAWRGNGTVLVADDEHAMRKILARMLRKLGLEPVLVEDGNEAVEAFQAEPTRFSLVLLDLTMPHLDGEQTFAELRRLRPDVRIVLMSGYNAQEAIQCFTGDGPPGFLQKPFTVDALRAVVQTALS